VIYLTLSIEGELDDARRTATENAVAAQGGSAVWRTSRRCRRTYALLEVPQRYDADSIEAASAGTVHDRPIIALAVFPTVPEALPCVLDARGGPGRPAGVLACQPCDGAVILEWDPNLSAAEVVLGLVDVELQRFGSGRTAELLAPLPAALLAAVAAGGLQAPQIEPARILEVQIGNG
jgi:hypothetical protein